MDGWMIALGVQVIYTIILGAFILGMKNNHLHSLEEKVDTLVEGQEQIKDVQHDLLSRVANIEGRLEI